MGTRYFGDFTKEWRDRIAARRTRVSRPEDHPALQSQEHEPVRRQFRYDEDARRKQLMERARLHKRHRRKQRNKSQAKRRNQVITTNAEPPW
jgi:hypothetical protein